MTVADLKEAATGGLDPAADPFIGPCPLWCRDISRGHQLVEHVADRVHVGGVRSVALALSDLLRFDDDGQVQLYPPSVDMQLHRQDREAEPAVLLSVNDEVEVPLSLGEVDEVIRALTALRDQAADQTH